MSMIAYSSIGPLLRKLRNDKNLTQRDVEMLSGIPHSNLCAIEKEKRKPSIDVLKKLSKLYNYNYTEFLQLAGYLDEDFNETASYTYIPIFENELDLLNKNHDNVINFTTVCNLDTENYKKCFGYSIKNDVNGFCKKNDLLICYPYKDIKDNDICLVHDKNSNKKLKLVQFFIDANNIILNDLTSNKPSYLKLGDNNSIVPIAKIIEIRKKI